jgi:hypothetical protein
MGAISYRTKGYGIRRNKNKNWEARKGSAAGWFGKSGRIPVVESEVRGRRVGTAWAWGIDTVIPMRAHETHGEGWDRMDCMRQPKGSAYSLPPDRTARAENTAKRLSHLNNLAKAIEDKQQFPLCSFVNIL